MADYLCKNCIHNNYGWCKAIKRNNLKEIDKCAIKDDGSKPLKLRPLEKLCNYEESKDIHIEYLEPQFPIEESTDESDNTESYRVLGKREMLWNIQKQALAIKKDKEIPEEIKFKELCECIKSIAITLEFSEKLYEVNSIIDSEIDMLMIEDSKRISKVL